MSGEGEEMRVLGEEKKEAEAATFGTLLGASVSAFCWAATSAMALSSESAAPIPFAFVFGAATLFCLLWFWRCRRTLRAWRRQERERLAVAEAERIGKEGMK